MKSLSLFSNMHACMLLIQKNAWFPALLFCKQSARNAHAHTSRHVYTIYIYTHTHIYIHMYTQKMLFVTCMHACMRT